MSFIKYTVLCSAVFLSANAFTEQRSQNHLAERPARAEAPESPKLFDSIGLVVRTPQINIINNHSSKDDRQKTARLLAEHVDSAHNPPVGKAAVESLKVIEKMNTEGSKHVGPLGDFSGIAGPCGQTIYDKDVFNGVFPEFSQNKKDNFGALLISNADMIKYLKKVHNLKTLELRLDLNLAKEDRNLKYGYGLSLWGKRADGSEYSAIGYMRDFSDYKRGLFTHDFSQFSEPKAGVENMLHYVLLQEVKHSREAQISAERIRLYNQAQQGCKQDALDTGAFIERHFDELFPMSSSKK